MILYYETNVAVLNYCPNICWNSCEKCSVYNLQVIDNLNVNEHERTIAPASIKYEKAICEVELGVRKVTKLESVSV